MENQLGESTIITGESIVGEFTGTKSTTGESTVGKSTIINGELTIGRIHGNKSEIGESTINYSRSTTLDQLIIINGESTVG